MGDCVCGCVCMHTRARACAYATKRLGQWWVLEGSLRGQKWQARWRSRPPWVSWKLIPSMVEKTWRVSVYVGMVSGVFSVIITRSPPATGSPGSLCSETSRRKRQNQKERRRKNKGRKTDGKPKAWLGSWIWEGGALCPWLLAPPPRQACTMYTLGLALRARQFLLFRAWKRSSSSTILSSFPLRRPSNPCAMRTTKAQLTKSSRASMACWNFSNSSWNCWSERNGRTQG